MVNKGISVVYAKGMGMVKEYHETAFSVSYENILGDEFYVLKDSQGRYIASYSVESVYEIEEHN